MSSAVQPPGAEIAGGLNGEARRRRRPTQHEIVAHAVAVNVAVVVRVVGPIASEALISSADKVPR